LKQSQDSTLTSVEVRTIKFETINDRQLSALKDVDPLKELVEFYEVEEGNLESEKPATKIEG
jgi:hypothetical protein